MNGKTLQALKSIGKFQIAGVIATTLACCYYYSSNTPRLGPIRALSLMRKSKAAIESVRNDEVQWIKKMLSANPTDHNFAVIRGPKGIGKSVAVKSAINDMRGVIVIQRVSPGTSQDEILNRVCVKITGIEGSLSKHEESMKRVVSFYKLYTGRVPIVIIPAAERDRNKDPAELTAAARSLVEEYGLIVLIDCSENALPELLSGREIILNIEPMSDTMMRKLPGFDEVFSCLREQGNEDVVMRLCTGRPIVLEQLKNLLKPCETQEQKRDVVEQFVINTLKKAKDEIERVSSHPNMKEV